MPEVWRFCRQKQPGTLTEQAVPHECDPVYAVLCRGLHQEDAAPDHGTARSLPAPVVRTLEW